MTPGAFGGNERMTLDSGAARPFYGALFGWETEDYPSEGMKYVMVKVGGEAVGGMMALPPECAGMPPAWDVYVTVADVDATARRVEELGGKLLRPPADIPDVSRFCGRQDPQGATLCAIAERTPRAAGPNATGRSLRCGRRVRPGAGFLRASSIPPAMETQCGPGEANPAPPGARFA
jgi:predicted enzyme related to lactoylglutathione lyase